MTVQNTDAVNRANGTTGDTTTTRTNKAKFGGTEFMTVLLAQLQNQNPLEPMQDKDIMAQMAQLNSLEELQSIKARMEEMTMFNQASLAASLIGKTVKGVLPDGTEITGKVTGTEMEEGSYVLTVNEKQLPFESVSVITEE